MRGFRRTQSAEESALFSHQLSRALGEPGCPICRLVRESEERWIWTLLYEFTGDPEIHTLLARSLGLCALHADLMRKVVEGRRLMTPSGVARLYETVVNALERKLQQGLLRGNANKTECPLCTYANGTAERQAYFLARLLSTREWQKEYKASDGLCWPHGRLVLKQASRGVQSWLMGDFVQRLERLGGLLAELQRKQRYDVPEPVTPEEADSWREALWRLGGMTFNQLLIGDD
ncbi:hypothetical protein H5T52_04780 [Candidatus Bipolaricaulota bacterium]|nr:hypothetical protein [Candidatus Bipolaricaulota bacterium]